MLARLFCVAFFSLYLQGADSGCEIIHPCTDFGFKRAIRNPDIASGFINHVLSLKGDDQVKEVTYVDTQLPSTDPLGKNFTVDVVCTTNNGRFLLEMQNDFRNDYPDKAFVELCRLVSQWDSSSIQQVVTEGTRKRSRAGETHGVAREFWQDIRRAIVLVITNKSFPATSTKTSDPSQHQMEPDIINTYRMMNTSHPGRFLGDMDVRVVLLMLDNFKKEEKNLKTDMDCWLYLFKEPALRDGVSTIPTFKSIQSLEKVAHKDTALQHFYNVLRKDKMNANDLLRFESELRQVNKVLDERKAEGVNEEKMRMALAMITDGDNDDKIIRITKLTQVQVQELRTHKSS